MPGPANQPLINRVSAAEQPSDVQIVSFVLASSEKDPEEGPQFDEGLECRLSLGWTKPIPCCLSR